MENENKFLITVIIVTYNRAYIINRSLMSLVRQTYKDFNVIIVDDGSLDETKKVVEEFSERYNLNIEYIYKQNGGVHTARNEGIRNTRTPFFVMLDSDDELPDDTIEFYCQTWNSFSEFEKEKFQLGISGLNYDMSKKRICGKKYSSRINQKHQRAFIKALLNGERSDMRNTAIFTREFPYTEIEGVKYVPEATMFPALLTKYRFYLMNKVVYYYHTDTAVSYTNTKPSMETFRCMYCAYLYKINHYFPRVKYLFVEQVKAYMYYVRFGFNLGYTYKRILGDVEKTLNKWICVCVTPLALIDYIFGQKLEHNNLDEKRR